MITLIFSIISFFSGAIPFPVIITRLLSGKDVRDVGDNNPGAVNAWKSGGSYIGIIVIFPKVFYYFKNSFLFFCIVVNFC